jgi:hypothetical protein
VLGGRGNPYISRVVGVAPPYPTKTSVGARGEDVALVVIDGVVAQQDGSG